MYTVRFHGRGGQGMKTASRVLGNAFFLAGFEVQDAPRYGAERRGAPMSAYVRAGREPINARGVILQAGLVVVADDSLPPVPAAGVLAGIGSETVMLIVSRETEAVWRQRLNLSGPLLVLPPVEVAGGETALVGAACVGAAACLTGAISREMLTAAVEQELGKLGQALLQQNVQVALAYYDRLAVFAGLVKQTEAVSAASYAKPAWIDLPLETGSQAAPLIQNPQTSLLAQTGSWRTQRPVIDYAHCHQCWWVCGSFCPDSAISLNQAGYPVIDYQHCKGCMICVEQCPSHAIGVVAEADAQKTETQGGQT